MEEKKEVKCGIEFNDNIPLLKRFYITSPKRKLRLKEKREELKMQKEEYLLGGNY